MADKENKNTASVGDNSSQNALGALLAMLGPQLLPMVEGAINQALPGLVTRLIGSLGSIFHKDRRPPVVVPHPDPTVATPLHVLDDDKIQPPSVVTDRVKVVRVAARLLMAQYSAKLHPDMYERKENDQGLYDNIQDYEDGKNALSRESKFWIDATVFAVGPDGKEMELDKNHPDVARLGLAYKTNHVIRDVNTDTITQIAGKGMGGDGKPAPGYLEETNTFVGMGITAWINSLGLNCQFKAFGEGEVQYWVVVDGVKSNVGRLRFS
jgi:hypothetical protein